MDRDMATVKVASHLLWILDGIFDGGFYVGSRGPKWNKLAESGHEISQKVILRGFHRNPFDRTNSDPLDANVPEWIDSKRWNSDVVLILESMAIRIDIGA